MATIVLHGNLAVFGGPYKRTVATPAEAIRALCFQLKGFQQAIAKGNYHIVKKLRDRDVKLRIYPGLAPLLNQRLMLNNTDSMAAAG